MHKREFLIATTLLVAACGGASKPPPDDDGLCPTARSQRRAAEEAQQKAAEAPPPRETQAPAFAPAGPIRDPFAARAGSVPPPRTSGEIVDPWAPVILRMRAMKSYASANASCDALKQGLARERVLSAEQHEIIKRSACRSIPQTTPNMGDWTMIYASVPAMNLKQPSRQDVAVAPLFKERGTEKMISTPLVGFDTEVLGAMSEPSIVSLDVVGSSAPELIFGFSEQAQGPTSHFVVCDQQGAWCTDPVMLDAAFTRLAVTPVRFSRLKDGWMRADGGAGASREYRFEIRPEK